ncbi:hypothetical protein IT570_05295 [Candidatus Sumerlaeota bacterium]|nr:hypothetical protein [Candidatus Sumerlaeota bacterium]
MPQNPGSARQYGDYVSNDQGAAFDDLYIYWIEVPPGTSSLTVEVYDADFGNSTTEGDLDRDEILTGNFGGNACEYRVFDPAGTAQGNLLTLNQTNTDEGLSAATANGTWQVVHRNGSGIVTITNPTAGHWRLEVNDTGTQTGDAVVNAIGIRAHDGTPGSGGVELNVYSDAFSMYGLNGNGQAPHKTRTYVEYPYVTSGCNCSSRSFDMDDVGSVDFEAPNGFTTSTGISSNNVWATTGISGFPAFGQTAFTVAQGYGIWERTVVMSTYGNNSAPTQNYSNFYMGNFAYTIGGATDPAATDEPSGADQALNKFRTYLPTDAGAAPLKPTARQFIRNVISGPNPPANGQTTILELQVEITNPTPFPITFAPSNRILARIPTPRVNYVGGSAIVSQGPLSNVAQPANAASNVDIAWNPGVVAAGTTASLRYRVRVTPTANNQQTAVTSAPTFTAPNTYGGTRMTYIDETGNTLQTGRSVVMFGPLCDLRITSGPTGSVLAANLLTLHASQSGDDQPVIVSWNTLNEWNNSGFYVHRAVVLPNGQTTIGERVAFVAASGDGSTGVNYSWADDLPLGAKERRGYYLVDVDLNGTETTHGPTFVNVTASGAGTSVDDWSKF